MNEETYEKDIENLKHMVGVHKSHPKKIWGYRNYFCAAPGEQTESMERLENSGLVWKGRTRDGCTTFYATKEGCKVAGVPKSKIEDCVNWR